MTVGTGDTSVHVHACSCACWAACLIWWWWDSSRRKHSLLRWQEQGVQLSVPPPPPPPPYPAASRLREKHCTQNEGFGYFSAKGCQQGFGEKSGSVAGLVPSLSPFLVHCALAAASWALTERQGCGAHGGWRLRELELPVALLSPWGTLVPKVFPISGTFCIHT